MRIFVDESGDFASNPPQISLHCAVIAPSSILVELYRRHLAWKVSVLGQHRRRELKANALTDAQLAGFMRDVIVPESALKVTMVGIDTALFTKATIESWRDLLSKLCLGAAQWSGDHGFSIAERQYREMGGWVWNRSAENIALIISLGETIWKALQNTIIWFHEKQFEKEFEDLEIVIDRSFVRNPTHELFWREIFRTYSTNKSRREPLAVPEEWHKNNHAFERKYQDTDESRLDLTSLFRDHMYFGDSRTSEGLQIADLCANICLRYNRRKEWFDAYRLLTDRIVGDKHGTLLVPQEAPSDWLPPTEAQRQVLERAKRLPARRRKHC